MNIKIKLWSKLNLTELKNIYSLWRICFSEDTWEDFRSYLKWRLYKGYFYGLYDDNDHLISTASLSPELIKIGDKWIKAGFIVGVGTKTEERHKGYSRRLLTYLAQDAQNKGLNFLLLSTHIPDFYENLNYVAYGLHYCREYTPRQGDVEINPLPKKDLQQMIFLWEKYAGCGTLKRNRRIMESKLKESLKAVGLYKDKELIGYSLQEFPGDTWSEVICPQELIDYLPPLGEKSYFVYAGSIDHLSLADKFCLRCTYQMILAFEDLPIKNFCCRDDY